MAINSNFDRYLAHLGATVPVSSLHNNPDGNGLRALRHDVDYDLDIALEMAHREHEHGARATYYVLPTTSYWDDPRLVEKCLQLQDYGHEVGLHVNCMAQWAGGETDDPLSLLKSQLARLREGGVEVVGIAAHGDRRCYEHNVSNYWCFQELRPREPLKNENGRTAEGPHEADGTPRLLYPANDIVERPGGGFLPLWSISMASLGLHYHAWHTNFDRYFSDSGGNWTRTPDPLSYRPESERWQVLMHPIHWQGPKRLYFFLSSARSGSRWLSEVLNEATPLAARHEYILNQGYHRGETVQKATATIRALEKRPEEIRARLSEAWEELQLGDGDYAEVNVYLESYVSELRRYFPQAIFVHLYREPAKVIRSLMDRDWYDTPEDHAHPPLRNADEASLNRFERVCQYVAEVNERLRNSCDEWVSLEEMTEGPETLGKSLKRIGIAYHPRLGQHSANSIVNATRAPLFPELKNWSVEQKQYFEKLFETKVSYKSTSRISNSIYAFKEVLNGLKNRLQIGRGKEGSAKERVILFRPENIYCHNFSMRLVSGSIALQPQYNGKHAYAMIGGCNWNMAIRRKNKRGGWKVLKSTYIKGSIEADMPKMGSVTLFAISYGKNNKKIHQRQLGVLDGQRPHMEFAFAPHPDGALFDIALHMPTSRQTGDVKLKKCQLVYKIHSP